MPIGNGGIIGPNNVPSLTSAKGVWSIQEAMLAQRAGTWPLPTPDNVDPYFYSVTALLHGDGTNGGQNNTFLDSSTNNFTITRNGNTTQGSFSPFSQTGWSNYLNGSSYLNTGANAAFSMGTGDLTWECWVNVPASGAYQAFIDTRTAGASYNDGYFFGLSTGTLYPAVIKSTVVLTSTTAIPTNQWVHMALVRSSGTITIYMNGTNIGSVADTTNLSNNTLGIGSLPATLQNPLTGYISNVRITKGGALYTANFTPSTTPLTTTVSAGTVSLLTCQANRFLDASSNNFTITRNGDVSVQPFSPFNPTTPYSTSSIGGSGYFDGSGDYLTVPNNAALQMGSGDFTFEYWWYPNNITSYQNPIDKGYSGAGAFLLQTGNGDGRILVIASGSIVITSSTAVTVNAWNHMAVVRSGTTLTLYQNGVSVGSATNSTNFNSTAPLGIGATATAPGGGSVGAWPIVGYLSNVRFVKGTAVYSGSTYTVPTAPLTAITNTQLLTNFTNGAIFDNAAVADYETVGNAQISTSVKKYGTGSIAFDGTGDWLTTPYTQSINFGTGDFTIEGWFYLNSFANQYYVLGGTWTTGTSDEWLIQIENNGSLRFLTTANTSFFATGLIKTGTWYHFAASRNAGVIKAYINGNVFATITNANSIGSVSKVLYLGTQNAGTWSFNGYLDDWRVSKGIGRYPYNFTPPTMELPNIGGTVTLTADPYFDYTTLLLPGNGTNGAQNNTFLDSSTNNFTITRNGNTTQGTFSPFSQTGWGNYFDGTGDFLTVGSSGAFGLGTGDFTIEMWIYPTANPANGPGTIFDLRAGATTTACVGRLDPSLNLLFYNSAANLEVVVGTAQLNTWTHVAFVRASGSLRTYVNGTLSNTTALGGDLGANQPCMIGNNQTAGYAWNGYQSNFRIVKGTAVYTSNFTPSTTPLTAISGTSLLTCQSNRFIDNSPNAFAITRNGDVLVQAFSPFNPTAAWSAATYGGSGYFDGSGDFLTAPSNAAFGYGTGDFTIEMWIYPTVISGSTPNIFDQRNAQPQVVPTIYINVGQLIYYTNGLNRITGATLVAGQWYHIAVCRASGSTRMFVNGVQSGSTYADANNYISSPVSIFNQGTGGSVFQAGYCGDVRVVKGTALYTAPFTPPTAPLTAISGTSLLLNYTNAGIYDATSKNDLETVGNAQISTTQSKFGGSSMLFDGTGDWLRAPASPNLDMGTGDLTIEGWFYLTATVAVDYRMIVSDATNGNNYVCIRGGGTGGQLEVNVNGTSFRLNLNNTVTINTWFHLAVVRYNGTWNGFVNGASLGTSAAAAAFNLGNGGTFVGRFGGATAYEWPGYIDDLRITKGIARYTSNFTPPTTAFLTL